MFALPLYWATGWTYKPEATIQRRQLSLFFFHIFESEFQFDSLIVKSSKSIHMFHAFILSIIGPADVRSFLTSDLTHYWRFLVNETNLCFSNSFVVLFYMHVCVTWVFGKLGNQHNFSVPRFLLYDWNNSIIFFPISLLTGSL